MNEIKQLSHLDDLSKLDITLLDWDLVFNDKPYQVVSIPSRIHSIGGHYGMNGHYAHPLDEEMSTKNLIAFCGSAPSWGIEIIESNYYRKEEIRDGCVGYITRNGKRIYHQSGRDLHYLASALQVKLTKLHEHSTWPSQRNWIQQNVLRRKVYYRDMPAIIESVCEGLDLILRVDGIPFFPASPWSSENFMLGSTNPSSTVKVDFFDEKVFWHRE